MRRKLFGLLTLNSFSEPEEEKEVGNEAESEQFEHRSTKGTDKSENPHLTSCTWKYECENHN
ncbi:hypothetical protein [Tolypothrix sp. VBCCA 56010]|uniref:hypothetical protein n=1 Tax=Tolypothrix sp. VBCCA 56010 TaxID=3137731 RepID=UPI003D7D069A